MRCYYLLGETLTKFTSAHFNNIHKTSQAFLQHLSGRENMRIYNPFTSSKRTNLHLSWNHNLRVRNCQPPSYHANDLETKVNLKDSK